MPELTRRQRIAAWLQLQHRDAVARRVAQSLLENEQPQTATLSDFEKAKRALDANLQVQVKRIQLTISAEFVAQLATYRSSNASAP